MTRYYKKGNFQFSLISSFLHKYTGKVVNLHAPPYYQPLLNLVKSLIIIKVERPSQQNPFFLVSFDLKTEGHGTSLISEVVFIDDNKMH